MGCGGLMSLGYGDFSWGIKSFSMKSVTEKIYLSLCLWIGRDLGIIIGRYSEIGGYLGDCRIILINGICCL